MSTIYQLSSLLLSFNQVTMTIRATRRFVGRSRHDSSTESVPLDRIKWHLEINRYFFLTRELEHYEILQMVIRKDLKMSEKRQHIRPGNLDPTCFFDTSEFELNKNGLNKSLQMAIRKDFIFGWQHLSARLYHKWRRWLPKHGVAKMTFLRDGLAYSHNLRPTNLNII